VAEKDDVARLFLPNPGDVLGGKYRIERKLGEGGMGSVYHAVDVTLGRNLAVKVLDPKMASDTQLQQRFEREARMARHLQHPNTIQIFDYGRAPSGLPYIVMEFLRGQTLEDIIRAGGAMPAARVVHLTKQILQSLAEAHANGVIHRDLKPSNVMVGEFGGQQDFAKVLDFGIAKLLDTERESGTLKTRSGLVIGSPAYMAPERLKSQDLTAASDLFSLGIMMAEMLAGKALYEGRTPVEVLANRLGRLPEPIPDFVRHSPLAAVLDNALQFEASQRFQSATEMMEALDTMVSSHGQLPKANLPQFFDAESETLHMDSSKMDLSKPRRPRAPAGPAAPVAEGPAAPSMWSNPLNVVLVVLIVLLLAVTLAIVFVTLS
jgi:eukaryotic-like serine/threonine-protein kinase